MKKVQVNTRTEMAGIKFTHAADYTAQLVESVDIDVTDQTGGSARCYRWDTPKVVIISFGMLDVKCSIDSAKKVLEDLPEAIETAATSEDED